jgi:glutamyl-tRNA reductase
MPVLALGVSHRHAPVELLERLAFGDDDYPKSYERLLQLDSVEEGVILSTCNRVEVYAEVSLYHQGFQDLKRFLAESREVAVEEFAAPLSSHYEDDAAEHLFAVAAGLDSMVLGEPQILAQVRAAFRRAESEGATGPALAALFNQAVRAGRRVRAETRIGASPSAFVQAGAALAERFLGGLEGRTVTLVGAGAMAGLAIEVLRREGGVGEILILGRRPERAALLAARTGASAGSIDDLDAGLSRADLVVSSTAATATVVHPAAVGDRGERPLFLLDLAVPRDVDPEVGALPGVRLCDIDGLRAEVASLRDRAGTEIDDAEAIVGEEARRYTGRRRQARVAPLIEALHARGEAVRAEELRKMARRLDTMSDREREAVDALTRRIVRRLLHHPVVRLKDLTGRGLEDPHAQALADLFDLDLPDD